MSKHIKTLIQEITGVSKLINIYEERVYQTNKEITSLVNKLNDKKEVLEKLELELDVLLNSSTYSNEKEITLKEDISFVKGQIKRFEQSIKEKELILWEREHALYIACSFNN